MRSATLLLVTLGLSQATPASAQDAAPTRDAEVSDAARETARNLMTIGDADYAAGRHAEALQAYQGADAIMGLSITRYSVGKTQAALGRLLRARDTLLSVRRLPIQSQEPDALVEARREAATLAYQLGKRIPTLRLKVIGAKRARVVIDGDVIVAAAAELPQRLDPGMHQIEVRAQGYATSQQTITLREAETRDVTIALKRLPTQLVPAPAPTPIMTSLSEPPSEQSNGYAWVSLSGFAVAGAGVIAGAVSGGLALSESSELDGLCNGDRCSRQLAQTSYDRTLALSHASTASFAIAGVGAVVGLVGVVGWLGSDSDEQATATVAWAVGPGQVSVRGRFW